MYEDIRLGCKLYHRDKRGPGYDRAYNAYFNNINPSISNLITFLSSWGCRKATSISTSDLKSVLQEVKSLLEPLGEMTILTIRCDEDFGRVENAYSKLLGIDNVGPTSASKILHTINPELLIAWDEHIINAYWYSDLNEYATGFLTEMQQIGKNAVDEIKKNQSCLHVAASQKLKSCLHDTKIKPSSIHPLGLAKVLDEYNFMKYTKKHPILAG